MYEDSVAVATVFYGCYCCWYCICTKLEHNQFLWPIPRVIHILCKNWHYLLWYWSDIKVRGTCRYHHVDIKVLSYGFNFNKNLWAYHNVWWAPLNFMWFDQTIQQTKDFITVEKHDLCLWSSTILISYDWHKLECAD